MNSAQKIYLWIGTLAFVGASLFPPWLRVQGLGLGETSRFSPIWQPLPKADLEGGGGLSYEALALSMPEIDLTLLLVIWAMIAAPTLAAVLTAGTETETKEGGEPRG